MDYLCMPGGYSWQRTSQNTPSTQFVNKGKKKSKGRGCYYTPRPPTTLLYRIQPDTEGSRTTCESQKPQPLALCLRAVLDRGRPPTVALVLPTLMTTARLVGERFVSLSSSPVAGEVTLDTPIRGISRSR